MTSRYDTDAAVAMVRDNADRLPQSLPKLVDELLHFINEEDTWETLRVANDIEELYGDGKRDYGPDLDAVVDVRNVVVGAALKAAVETDNWKVVVGLVLKIDRSFPGFTSFFDVDYGAIDESTREWMLGRVGGARRLTAEGVRVLRAHLSGEARVA